MLADLHDLRAPACVCVVTNATAVTPAGLTKCVCVFVQIGLAGTTPISYISVADNRREMPVGCQRYGGWICLRRPRVVAFLLWHKDASPLAIIAVAGYTTHPMMALFVLLLCVECVPSRPFGGTKSTSYLAADTQPLAIVFCDLLGTIIVVLFRYFWSWSSCPGAQNKPDHRIAPTQIHGFAAEDAALFIYRMMDLVVFLPVTGLIRTKTEVASWIPPHIPFADFSSDG